MKELTLPVFVETIGGVECRIDPAGWTREQQQAMLDGAYKRGLRIILQSSTTGKASAIMDKCKALQSGDYSFGKKGSRGVPRQGPEERAWVDYCNSMGLKEDGKAINGKTLERAQRKLCRQALIAEHAAGTPERKDIEENLGWYISQRFDNWIKEQEETNLVLKLGIEYQRALAAQKKMAK